MKHFSMDLLGIVCVRAFAYLYEYVHVCPCVGMQVEA